MGLNMFNLWSRKNHLKGWPPSDMYVLKRTCLYLSHAGWMNHEAEEERARKEKNTRKIFKPIFEWRLQILVMVAIYLVKILVIPSKGKLKGDDQNIYK